MHIGSETKYSIWHGVLIFDTSLSIFLLVYGICNKFCAIIWAMIGAHSLILVAKTVFTLVLCRSRKSYIFCLKNIGVCLLYNNLLFFMLQKIFINAFDRYVWIKLSFVWCILAFVAVYWWVIRIYMKVNCFGVLLMR